MLRSQSKILKSRDDFEVLNDSIALFPNLEKVFVAAGYIYDIPRSHRNPFKPSLENPHTQHTANDSTRIDDDRHLNSILLAAAGSKQFVKLRGTISWRYFQQDTELLQAMASSCQSLRSVHFEIETDTNKDDVWENGECQEHLKRTGVLRKFFGALPNLEAIKVKFWEDDEGLSAARLEQIIPTDFTWPKLRKLWLTGFETEEDLLFSVIMKHRDTLRHLELSDVSLSTGGS
jgi:hypothetical protein